MALRKPDIIEHNNPNLAAMDADFVRGGRRYVVDLAALYALAAKPDQLKAFVTEVYVYTLGCEMMLVDIANAGNVAGWLPKGDGRYLKLAGGTMTGDIDMGAKSIFGQLAAGTTNQWSIGKNPFFGNLQFTSDGTSAADYSCQLVFNRLGNNTKYLNYNPTFYGDTRLKFGANPAAGMESLAYLSDVDAAKAYAETLVVGLFDDRGNYDPTVTSLYPASGGSGAAGAIKKGDIWTVTVAGTVNAIPVDAGDTIRALSDAPGQTNGNWAISQGNVYQADETQRGIAKVATSGIVANEASTNDTDFVTTKKLWQNFWPRMLALAQTYAAKITFNLAPRFSSVTASQYLKVDANKDLTSVSAIPAADVTESTTKRFITDAERTTWNGKQNALTAAVSADIQTGTDTAKFTTPKAVNDFWVFLKGTAAQWVLGYMAGGTNRMVQVDTAGTVTAANTIIDQFTTDSDVITAIAGATYNSGNNFKATLAPANSKVFNQGQLYTAGSYLYMAVADNVCARILLG